MTDDTYDDRMREAAVLFERAADPSEGNTYLAHITLNKAERCLADLLRLRGAMMTLDELRGHVADVLAAPLSDDRTLQELRSRVNGADPNQLLVAALAVARELVSQKIAELERALEDSEEERQQLEDEMQELQDRIQSFARKCETESNRR